MKPKVVIGELTFPEQNEHRCYECGEWFVTHISAKGYVPRECSACRARPEHCRLGRPDPVIHGERQYHGDTLYADYSHQARDH